MNTLSGLRFALAAGALSFAARGGASAADARCTDRTLTVDGAPIVVRLCADSPRAAAGEYSRIPIVVTEQFTSADKTFTQSITIELSAGARVARAMDDVPLEKFGMSKTLHITIGVRNGTPKLERALLLPGAIPLT